MKAPRWPGFVAAALGVVWFIQIGGGPGLNPMNTRWLWSGDWRQHWLGFLFFQREPWHWPLGKLTSLLYPIGTNIGFTDSNPLLAILVKPFAAWLPYEYQLIGLWLALCFALQGYVGAKLARAVTDDPAQQMLGGYLFVLSPVLSARIGHDTLCAQWLPLGMLYLGIREYADPADARRTPLWVAGGTMLAAAIHPYLAAMTFVLGLAAVIRLWRVRALGPGRALGWMAAATAGLLGVWAAIGYFGRTPDLSGGFGVFSADLLTLVDPMDYSRLLPPAFWRNGAWEGFGFVGLGGLIAVAVAIVIFLKQRPAWRPGLTIPIAACVLLGIYALSSTIRFAGNEIVDLHRAYDYVMPVVRPFRSSGRFIWPLTYLLLVFGFWGITRAFGPERRQMAIAALGVIVALQASDLRADPWSGTRTSKTPIDINLATFDIGRGHYRHLALSPMEVLGACSDPYGEDYVYRMMLLAHRLGLTFNSGIYARLDIKKVQAACEAEKRAIDADALDPVTIYIASPEDAALMKQRAGAACGRWDGNWICVSRSGYPRFATWIETGKDPG